MTSRVAISARAPSSVALIALLLGAPQIAAAQWLEHPTRGVPRTADGAPDLAAPAPRALDGKPSLSGMWFSAELLPECSEDECIPQAGLPADQVDIGRSLEGGLPYQPWAAELVAGRTASGSKDDPHARCLPPNFPRAFSFPQYIKIVQTPELIVVLHEFNASYRQIFTDGRPLPVDPIPRGTAILGPMGRGHARHRDDRVPRRSVARPQG